jgi:tetratricopeptide (TPR) repeat protein
MRVRRIAIGLVGFLLLVLSAAPALCAQAADPRADFQRALAQFSLGLEGAYGDEGSQILASLDAMAQALEQWDAAIRAAESGLQSEIGRAEAPIAARMRATLAGAYLDRGRTADALREFTTASELDPGRADVHAFLGLIHSQVTGDSALAASAFGRAAALDARNPVRWYALAQQLLKNGSVDEARGARQIFRETWDQQAIGKGRTAIDPPFARLTIVPEKSRVEPFFPPVLYVDGFARLERGDYAGAIAQFRDQTAHDPLTARPVQRLEALGQGAAAFRDGSLDIAIRRLTVAIELEPARAELHRILGRVYLANEQDEEAVAELAIAAQLNPLDERTRLTLADALVGSGRLADAERVYRDMIGVFPASGRARYELARICQRQGRYDETLRELGTAITFHPLLGLNGIYQIVASLNAARQNFDAALHANRQRVEILPNDADAHRALGDTFARLGRRDEALAEYAMTLMLATGRADAYTAMSQLHLEDGRYADAVDTSQRALLLDADLPQAHYLLGTALLRLGRSDEGQQALADYQRLQAAAAAAHAREIELGGIRREAAESSANGDHEHAVSLLRRALALEPDAAVSHLNLGLALLYAGYPAEAVDRFNSAVALTSPPDVHRHLAAAYAALGRLDDSRRELALYEQLKRESLRRAGASR